MSIRNVVYCHLCPLKEFCPNEDSDNSYNWSRGNHAKDMEEQERYWSRCNWLSLRNTSSVFPLRKVLS